MAVFAYKAVRRNGEKVTGEMQAGSRGEACELLDRQKLQPIFLELKTAADLPGKDKNGGADAQSKEDGGAPFAGGSIRLSRGQLILFTEELSDLLEAGLQLEPALRVMETRQEASAIKTVAGALRQYVREGISLSIAMRRVSNSFGELYCNLVAAGEASGALEKILQRQLAFLTLVQELQSKVTQALLYPAFICAAGIMLLFVFTTYLIPQLTVLLQKTGKKQPFATRLLIGTSEFMVHWWWAVLLGMLLAALGFRAFIKQPQGRVWWDRTQMKIPLFGPILNARFYAQFCQTLSTLVKNGIPLLGALKLVQSATSNVYLRGLLTRVVELVAEGAPLSRSITKVGSFPTLLVDMMVVGEQTGDMGTALEKAGNRYDKDLNKRIQFLTALIQPAVIVLMAILVGIVAYAMVSGIFSAIAGIRTRM